jgi:hypothetical protein
MGGRGGSSRIDPKQLISLKELAVSNAYEIVGLVVVLERIHDRTQLNQLRSTHIPKSVFSKIGTPDEFAEKKTWKHHALLAVVRYEERPTPESLILSSNPRSPEASRRICGNTSTATPRFPTNRRAISFSTKPSGKATASSASIAAKSF